MKWMYDCKFEDALYFYINTECYHPKFPKLSTDISKQIYEGFTVTYGAIKLSVYMGFKEIYLIGMDFNYSVSINDEGKIIYNKEVRSCFSRDNNLNLNLPNLENNHLPYQAAQKYADEHKLKMYKATCGGKLEIFERVKFDNLFN